MTKQRFCAELIGWGTQELFSPVQKCGERETDSDKKDEGKMPIKARHFQTFCFSMHPESYGCCRQHQVPRKTRDDPRGEWSCKELTPGSFTPRGKMNAETNHGEEEPQDRKQQIDVAHHRARVLV